MKHTVGLLLIFVALTVCGPVASAQQAKKVLRLGYLMPSDAATDSARGQAIRIGLRDLGYIEGQNISIEYRYAKGKYDRFPELAAELVRLKVDIIVTTGVGPTLAAKNATKTIPIVMNLSADPVEVALVESLARPGGNITGLTTLARELDGKRLELFKEAVPKVNRIAVLYDPASADVSREVKEDLPVAARALGLGVRSWEVRDSDGFEQLFAALNKERPDALYVTVGPLMRTNEKRLAGFALKSRLPSTYNYRQAVDAGGLMYYGRTKWRATDASPPTWTKSARALSPPICRCSSLRSSS